MRWLSHRPDGELCLTKPNDSSSAWLKNKQLVPFSFVLAVIELLYHMLCSVWYGPLVACMPTSGLGPITFFNYNQNFSPSDIFNYYYNYCPLKKIDYNYNIITLLNYNCNYIFPQWPVIKKTKNTINKFMWLVENGASGCMSIWPDQPNETHNAEPMMFNACPPSVRRGQHTNTIDSPFNRQIIQSEFSPTSSCVSLTRSTTSSEWKLCTFDKMDINSFQIVLIDVTLWL